MKKTVVASLLFLLTFSMTIFGYEIIGFWKVLKEDSQDPDCIVAIYPYEGRYYGRILATYNEEGVIDDTIYAPKSRAPGIEGEPFYCGMDIIWGLYREEDDEYRYKGKIIDPQEGKIYNAEAWLNEPNLIVRGEVWIFGENLVWPPAKDSDFTKDFKKPDVSTFVPLKPQVK